MSENKTEKNEVIEIDIKRVMEAVWHRVWLIILIAVLCAALAFAGTFYLITPQYQSSAMFYVNNSNFSLGDTSLSITSGDITAAKSLVDSYIVILNTRTSLIDVIDYSEVNRTPSELREMIEAAAVNSTEVFEVIVTSEDPYEAEKIATAISYILPKRISSIIEGTSAKVVDTAVVAARPSSPNYVNNTIVGFALGFALAICVIALRELFDVTIRTEEDISKRCEHPVLVAVPNMAASGRGGYYCAYGQKSRRKQKIQDIVHKEEPALVGGKISFAASEAYKLLRTKLQFSFADDKDCHVIGISSALAGEGKSLTSINLAYSLAQLDKKVLLIDCDMRRPSLNKKLPIKKMPGLSNYLAGQSSVDELVQYCGIADAPKAFCVIASGRNPPNPIELLSSARMSKVLQYLRARFDYIILDLPPVAEVSDAMAVAKETDGMLLVVRQKHGNHIDLMAAVREFEFVGAKLLGVVYNCAQDTAGGYYGRKYYKRYYRKYYHRYEGRYLSAEQAREEKNSDAGETNG